MSDQTPEFETDEELEAWFDDADLGVDGLEPALDVEVGSSIELVFDQPWAAHIGSVSAVSGDIRSRVPEPV